MSTLRDIKETSDVNTKQIHEYYKKNIVKDVLELKSEIVKDILTIKTRNRRTPMSKISKQLEIPESTLRSYMNDMDITKKRKQMSTSEKNESQMKMQLGKAKARYLRDEITEDEYNAKVSEIKKKFSVMSSSLHGMKGEENKNILEARIRDVSKENKVSKQSHHMNLRGGKASSDSDDESRVITEEEAQQKVNAFERAKQIAANINL